MDTGTTTKFAAGGLGGPGRRYLRASFTLTYHAEPASSLEEQAPDHAPITGLYLGRHAPIQAGCDPVGFTAAGPLHLFRHEPMTRLAFHIPNFFMRLDLRFFAKDLGGGLLGLGWLYRLCVAERSY